MHVRVGCTRCWQESGHDNSVGVHSAELLDDGVIRSECANGHKVVHIIQTPTFELLFELGVIAVAQREYREAVMTTSTSWDTFKRFCVELVLIRSGVTADVAREIARTTRHDKHGAFDVVYAIGTGRAFADANALGAKLRNRVTHEGTIPTREEAIVYGEGILRVMQETVVALHFDRDDCQQLIFADVGRRHQKEFEADATLQRSTTAFGTVVQPWSASAPRESYREHLSEIERYGHPMFRPGCGT